MNKIDWYGDDPKAAKTVIIYINWLARMGLYDTMDCVLLTLDMKASTLILVSFIRYTVSSYKIRPYNTPSWPIARDIVAEELDRRGERGENAKGLLRGLRDL